LDNVINLFVNGDAYKLVIQSNWTLQYVLHNELGFTGTKEICAEGACDARPDFIVTAKALLDSNPSCHNPEILKTAAIAQNDMLDRCIQSGEYTYSRPGTPDRHG
jgi:xanthine dehydrogenase iron-sulfur cluster and FAD-binding subunit A